MFQLMKSRSANYANLSPANRTGFISLADPINCVVEGAALAAEGAAEAAEGAAEAAVEGAVENAVEGVVEAEIGQAAEAELANAPAAAEAEAANAQQQAVAEAEADGPLPGPPSQQVVDAAPAGEIVNTAEVGAGVLATVPAALGTIAAAEVAANNNG